MADASARLRTAIARAIRFDPSLAASVEALSADYRSGTDGTEAGGHVRDAETSAAYAATRMPATFAAVASALGEGARSMPGFTPRSLLDVGAGTGAAAWAAAAVWPTLVEATLLDSQPAMVALGRRLAAADPVVGSAAWRLGDAVTTILPPSDLVLATYLLGELREANRGATIDRLWAATTTALVLVEPGSRGGFERILEARSALIDLGAAIAAPCPGNVPCPVRSGPVWCHFLARLERSPLHRRAKGAALSWEDEPYAYVVAVRPEAGPAVGLAPAPRVVLGRPRRRPGVVELRVCRDGRVDLIVRSRRDRAAYRTAGDLGWGDRVPADVADNGSAAADPGDGQDS